MIYQNFRPIKWVSESTPLMFNQAQKTVTFTVFKNTIFLKYMYNEATSKKCMHHKDKTKRPLFVT